MNRWRILLCLVLGIGALSHSRVLGDTAVTRETAAALQVTQLRIGFENRYRVGYWTPVWLTVRNSGPTVRVRLELITLDGDGVPACYAAASEEAVTLESGAEKSLVHYVKFGRLRPSIQVRFLAANDTGETSAHAPVIASQQFVGNDLPAAQWVSQRLAVTLGESIGVEQAARLMGYSETQGWEHAQLTNSAQLPDRWFGLEGVSTLILTTRNRSVIEPLSDQQIGAIHDWVRLGGKLILCVGANGKELLAQDAPLSRWVPGTYSETALLKRTTGLENFATSTESLDIGDRREPKPVPVTVLTELRGKVEAYEGSGSSGDVPLVVRMPLGLGQVLFVAFDPEANPVAQWPGRSRFVARLLEETSRRVAEDTDLGQVSQTTRLGYDDMIGQLRTGLEQFPSVPLIPFSWVVGMALLYVAVLGPADYFFWRWLQRPSGTWISMPLIVGLGCVAAIGMAKQFKSTEQLSNRLEIVDIDCEQKIIRGSTWLNLYSPRAERWNISLQPTTSHAAGSLFSWQGLPGHGLGGMYSVTPSPLANVEYRVPALAQRDLKTAKDTNPSTRSDSVTIAGVPFSVASTRGLTARWWSELPADATESLQNSKAMQLTHSETTGLRGTIINPLSVELTDVALLYERSIYPLEKNLRPGETVDVADVLPRRRDIERHFTRRRIGDDNKDVSLAWDETDIDVARVAEVMMFHEAAGGQPYTRLANRYQQFIDLTDALRLGRAVLLGRGSRAACELNVNGQPFTPETERRWTYYRLVIPVEKSRS